MQGVLVTEGGSREYAGVESALDRAVAVRAAKTEGSQARACGPFSFLMTDEQTYPQSCTLENLFLKARPATEGDERFVYCEPSNENLDQQRERVLQKALAQSVPYFLRFGNLDIEHRTLIGSQIGIEDPDLYEIGQPVDVRLSPTIVVKGRIYQGSGKTVEQANRFWASITEQSPPKRWYPSVGGRTLAKARNVQGGKDIWALRWSNVGFAREPVNTTVKAVSTAPLEVFCKALTAGYGTDAASFSGGRALQPESLEGKPVRADFHKCAVNFLKAVGTGSCSHTIGVPTLAKAAEHFHVCEGMDSQTAWECATRMFSDVQQRASSGRMSAA